MVITLMFALVGRNCFFVVARFVLGASFGSGGSWPGCLLAGSMSNLVSGWSVLKCARGSSIGVELIPEGGGSMMG